ncbi:hypothetical protein Fmac_026771 [Flemingia macrophylla]|uniref:Uncharacterized protein n=1 Tax=Flemingia macrophylla TaxID=520843 RepID=A0ABD1LFS7_9FABA
MSKQRHSSPPQKTTKYQENHPMQILCQIFPAQNLCLTNKSLIKKIPWLKENHPCSSFNNIHYMSNQYFKSALRLKTQSLTNPVLTQAYDDHIQNLAYESILVHNRLTCKGLLLWLFPFCKSKSGFYALIFAVVFLFPLASMVMQSSITSVFRQRAERGRYLRHGLRFGSSSRFVPGRLSRTLLSGHRLDRLRSLPRVAVRAPRIALVSSLSLSFFLSMLVNVTLRI